MKISRMIYLFMIGAMAMTVTMAQGEETPPPLLKGFNLPLPTDLKAPPAFGNISRAKEWGAKVVRLQLNTLSAARTAYGAHTFTQENIDAMWPKCLDAAEAAIQEAEKQGVKVVLDLHNPPFAGNRTAISTWKDPQFAESFTKAWTEMAKRFLPYSERGVIWGYDIYNEPVITGETMTPDDYRIRHGGSAEPIQWMGIATKIISEIRKIDPKVWIVFEPGMWDGPQAYCDLTPLADKRVIYSVHVYDPHTFTHQGVATTVDTPLTEIAATTNISYPGVIDHQQWDKARMVEGLKWVRDFQLKYNVPIYVGEFSVIRWAPKESAVNWLKDTLDIFQEYGWSGTYHADAEGLGWIMEYNEDFCKPGMPAPKMAEQETERAKVIKAYLQKTASGDTPRS